MTQTHSAHPFLPAITDPATGRVYPLIAGGSDDVDLEALLARLPSDDDASAAGEPLTDDELAALEQALVAEAEELSAVEAPSQDDVDAVNAVADQLDQVRAEQTARAEASEQAAAALAEARARIAPADTDDTDDDDVVAEADDDDAEVDATADEAPADEPAPQVEVVREAPPDRIPVAASAAVQARRQAARRRASANTPQQRDDARGPRVIAAADVPGFGGGQQINSLRQVGEAFAARAEAARRGRGRGRFAVATIDTRHMWEDGRRLGGDVDNDARIAAVRNGISQEAIVAAGGLCAPVDVRYDLMNVATDRRPIRDALVRFNADRGGIRYNPPPILRDVNSDTDGTYASTDDTAVALWTEATDETPGTNVKPSQTIVCNAATEVDVSAITKRVTVGNFSRRYFPEQFDQFWALAGALHARVAENYLWNQIEAGSTAVTAGELLGAARDVYATLDRAAAIYRSHHRMSLDAPLRMLAPEWLADMMRADLVRQIAGDNTYAVTRDQIETWLAARNINVTWSPDAGDQEFNGTQGVGPLQGWPTTVDVLFFPEGSWLHLDGGTLDLGTTIRDTNTIDTNDVEAFMETFENAAHVGPESWEIQLDLCASGEASGTIDINPCVSGS